MSDWWERYQTESGGIFLTCAATPKRKGRSPGSVTLRVSPKFVDRSVTLRVMFGMAEQGVIDELPGADPIDVSAHVTERAVVVLADWAESVAPSRITEPINPEELAFMAKHKITWNVVDYISELTRAAEFLEVRCLMDLLIKKTMAYVQDTAKCSASGMGSGISDLIKTAQHLNTTMSKEIVQKLSRHQIVANPTMVVAIRAAEQIVYRALNEHDEATPPAAWVVRCAARVVHVNPILIDGMVHFLRGLSEDGETIPVDKLYAAAAEIRWGGLGMETRPASAKRAFSHTPELLYYEVAEAKANDGRLFYVVDCFQNASHDFVHSVANWAALRDAEVIIHKLNCTKCKKEPLNCFVREVLPFDGGVSQQLIEALKSGRNVRFILWLFPKHVLVLKKKTYL
jgi:hypothetical protein